MLNGSKAMTDAQLNAVIQQSAQDIPDISKDGISAMWLYEYRQGPILPPWGTRRREQVLRIYDRQEYGTLWQGAKAGLVKKWTSTPWEISGGRNLSNYFQRVWRASQFTGGWDSFLTRVCSDFLRFDGGAWIEVIAPGDEMREPTGMVTGLAHLDSFWCYPTGDPEHPVLYWSRYGKLHKLHRSRVIHLVDMEDGDQNNPGYGLCALSRAIAVVERQMYLNRYIVSNLDDKPSPGVVIANNIDSKVRDNMIARYTAEQNNDAPPPWGNVMWIYNLDPAKKAELENFTFSRPPEKFDYPVYMQVDVDDMALAIGVDPQDLRPLSSKALGSGMQSEVLDEKGKGNTYAAFLRLFERKMNDVLPESLEFAFKTSDSTKAQKDATTAQVWVTVATALAPMVGAQVAAQLLADQVPALEKVLIDDAGNLVQLGDVDVQPAAEENAKPVGKEPPAAAAGTGKPTTQETTATDSTPNARKDFADTEASFETDLVDLIHAGLDGDVNRRRAGVVMRGILNSYGKRARLDGLVENGVTTGLSDADLSAHTIWLAEQSKFVSEFLTSSYKSGLTDAQIEQHVKMWGNVSLTKAYYEGAESANANAVYQFVGDDGAESCETCQSLKNKTMRMSEWAAQKLRPGVDLESYACKGFSCAHRLERVNA
jgi:hypothetical protein